MSNGAKVGSRLVAPAVALALLAAGCAGHARRPTLASRPPPRAPAPPAESGVGGVAPAGSESGGATAPGAPGSRAAGHLGSAAIIGNPSAAIAPGIYRYTVSGTVSSLFTGAQPVPGSATLRVDAPTGLEQRQVLSRSDENTEQVLRFRPDGTYLSELRLTTAVVDKDFRSSSPVLLVPVSASIDTPWSWTMKSTDGATTLQATLRVLRTETVTVGGDAVKAVVVDAVLVASGDVSLRTHQTLWGSPVYKLVVRQQEASDGNYRGLGFHSQSTAQLASVRPD